MRNLTNGLVWGLAMTMLLGCGGEGGDAAGEGANARDPNVASAARTLALNLRPDKAAVASHYESVAKDTSVSPAKVEVKSVSRRAVRRALRRLDNPDTDMELVKEEQICFWEYKRGEESGVVPGSVYDCERADNERNGEEYLADRRKEVEAWLERQTAASTEEESEAAYLHGALETAAKAVAIADGFDIEACVGDAIEVFSGVESQLLEERCARSYDGEELLAVHGELLDELDTLIEERAESVKEAADAAAGDDNDKGEAVRPDPADALADIRKAVNEVRAWYSGRNGAEGRLLMTVGSGSVNEGLARACLNKWLFDNAAVQQAQSFSSAVNLCKDAAGAGRD